MSGSKSILTKRYLLKLTDAQHKWLAGQAKKNEGTISQVLKKLATDQGMPNTYETQDTNTAVTTPAVPKKDYLAWIKLPPKTWVGNEEGKLRCLDGTEPFNPFWFSSQEVMQIIDMRSNFYNGRFVEACVVDIERRLKPLHMKDETPVAKEKLEQFYKDNIEMFEGSPGA